MKTDEIRSALCNTKLFDDVYSVDTLPACPRGLLVCNMNPSYRPGTHWVAIYVDPRGKRAECFDSFDKEPCKTTKEYLNRRCKRWTHKLASYRASLVCCVDTTVYIIACLEVAE